MEHENIGNLNLLECEKNPHDNHDSELIDAATARQRQLVNTIFNTNKREDEMKSNQLYSFETKMIWIDMTQFNEKKVYRNYIILLVFMLIILLVSAMFVGFSTYYTSFEHCIYAIDPREQALYVGGIESLLIKLGIITINPFLSETTFPTTDKYLEGNGTAIFSISFVISMIVFSIFYIFHSPLAKDIYSIQGGDKYQKFRVIQDEKGNYGICKLGFHNLKKILPFEYDKIIMIAEGSFICKKNDKVGLYNTDVNKFTVPVIYDEVYFIDKTSLSLRKGNEVYSFTNKGYRIVK